MEKKYPIAIALMGALALFACHKSGGVNTNNLALLQHKWMVVSEKGDYPFATNHTGYSEFDPYIGWYNSAPSDYWNFSTNDTLYRYIGSRYDTSGYTMSSDGRTLTLHFILNGIHYSEFSLTISSLTNSQLILSKTYIYNGPVPLLDSLKR